MSKKETASKTKQTRNYDEFFHANNRAEWRRWLEKNHEKKSRIHLIKYKKHVGNPTVTRMEAMEEAICFGWIDTTIKKLDDKRYSQCFVRRNEKSRWSKNTLSYGKKLIAEGKMSTAGLKAYKEGLKKPTIDHNIPKDAPIPEELKKALQKNNLLESFNSLAPSYRRTYIIWIERAKLPETRAKRINSIIIRTKEKKKPGTLKV